MGRFGCSILEHFSGGNRLKDGAFEHRRGIFLSILYM